MSPLMKLKARLGFYSTKLVDKKLKFFQFYLDHKQVTKKFESKGIKVINSYKSSGIPGFSREMGKLGVFVHNVSKSNSLIRNILNIGLGTFASDNISLICINKK